MIENQKPVVAEVPAARTPVIQQPVKVKVKLPTEFVQKPPQEKK